MRAVLATAATIAVATAAATVLAAAGPERQAGAASAAGARPLVSVSPAPGTRTASPRTQISLRGTSPRRIGRITVTGSRTGRHTGRLRRHSDGRGASWLPRRRFAPGERVTVRTSLRIGGARGGTFRFTVSRPYRYGPGVVRRTVRGRPGDVASFRSRPDLRPPRIDVVVPAGDTAPGLLFLGPKKGAGQSGAMIADNRGEPVWFRPVRGRNRNANNFRAQTYRDRPVLTWWEGRVHLPGYGLGRYVIADQAYRTARRFGPGNGYRADSHELVLTSRDTALVTAYQPVRWDLRGAGGRRDDTVVDGIVQEVDIETGLVLFEWHSLDHVDVRESDARRRRGLPYDYFHVNSIDELPGGDLLVSGRNTHGVYAIDRATSKVLWRLGGKRSDFELDRAARFYWQHDAQHLPDGTITILDNAAVPPRGPVSRGISLRLDHDAGRATLVRAYDHPDGALSGAMANMQTLPGGNVLIGWGNKPDVTEYTPGGELMLHARLRGSNDSYRAFRMPWTGRPRTRPSVAAQPAGPGEVDVWVSWNGATEVERWQVLAGESTGDLKPVATAPRSGFETHIRVSTGAPLVAVRALDAQGRTLRTSSPMRPS